MARASAKDKIVESMSSMLNNVENAIKDATKAAAVSNPDDPISKLAQLEKEYQTVNVKIYRKQANGAKYEFFTELQGFPLSELLERGPDSICREEGGGGDYSVKIHVPGDRGAARVSLPVTISGPSRMVPAHGSALDASFGFGAGMGLPGFGVPNSTPFGAATTTKKEDDKAAWAQQRQYEQLIQTTQNSNDRMMMMMMQQQQQQAAAAQQQQQMMAQMFAGMFSAQKESASTSTESDRVRSLEEKIERIRQEAQQREELSRRDRELSELKQRLEVVGSKPQNSEKDWLVPLMTMMNSSNSQQMNTVVEFMKMAQDKPSEMERMGNFMATISSVMNNSFEGQAHLLQVMKEMNSGGELTGKDFLFKGLEGMMELGSQALEASVARAQAKAEAAEAQARVMELPTPPVHTLQAPSASSAVGALPEHKEHDEQEHDEQEHDDDDEDGIAIELLTDGEMDRLTRDAALQKVVASLMNGDHPSEATARLFFHAQSGNAIAQKWLNFPYDITDQVLESFGTKTLPVQKLKPNGQREMIELDLIQTLGDDVVSFSEYLEKGGDPAKWAKTGYTPKKKSQSQEELDPALRSTNPPPIEENFEENLDLQEDEYEDQDELQEVENTEEE